MPISHETIQDNHQTQLHFLDIHADNEPNPAHWHEHLEIIFLVYGQMTAYINEISYDLKNGDCLIVNPKDIHSTYVYPYCHYFLLQIPPTHLERMSTDWKRIHFHEYLPASFDEETTKTVSEYFQRLQQLEEKKETGYQLLFLSKIYELLYLLYTKNSSLLSVESKIRSDRDFERIEQSIAYIKEHYIESITLTEMSKLLSISVEYFCRLFKKYTGQTFLAYVNQVRLLHFYQDLLHTEDSITFLLDKNGITNYKAFMRDFKKAYGTTPHRLRLLSSNLLIN